MKKIAMLIIGVLFLLEGCKNKNPFQDLPDGINEISYPNGKLHKVFYINKGKLNGLYKEFNENGEVTQITTYKNGKRDGLFDTLLSKGHVSEFFYQNDTVVGMYENMVLFNTYLITDKNFIFISPKNWGTKEDTVNGEYCIRGRSIKFNGHFTPNFVILYKELNAKSVESAIDSAIIEDSQSGIVDIKRDVDVVSRRVLIDNDTIILDSKIIKNDYGFWVMTCAASDSNYAKYQFLFRTMLNSFTPIVVKK